MMPKSKPHAIATSRASKSKPIHRSATPKHSHGIQKSQDSDSDSDSDDGSNDDAYASPIDSDDVDDDHHSQDNDADAPRVVQWEDDVDETFVEGEPEDEEEQPDNAVCVINCIIVFWC